VAYELQLPEFARVHPVFHVSLLRPFKGSAGEPPFLYIESTYFSLPSALNSTQNPSQKYLNSPHMETNVRTPGVPLTAGTDLPCLKPHAHAPQKSPSTSHNDLNTPPARATGRAPRIPLIGDAVAPRLEPSANIQNAPTTPNSNSAMATTFHYPNAPATRPTKAQINGSPLSNPNSTTVSLSHNSNAPTT